MHASGVARACLLVGVLSVLIHAGSVTPSGPPYSFAYTAFAAGDPFVLSQATVVGTSIQLSDGSPFGVSSARLSPPMLVGGFTTTFTVQMTNYAIGQGLEGVAFVIVNGPQAFGETGAGLGYADSQPFGTGGLPNSFAFEVDTFSNVEMADPPYEHFSVHSAGAAPNSALENGTARICGPFINIPAIATAAGAPYTVSLTYMPPFAWAAAGSPATLVVSVAGVPEPVGSCQLESIESLVGVGLGGSAQLMFTASSGVVESDIQSLNAWSYQYLGVVAPNVSTAQGPTTTVAGVQFAFSIQARDQFGALYAVPGDAPTAVLPSGVVVDGEAVTNGTYSVTLALTRAETAAAVRIQLNGVDVSGSPFAIAVTPAAVSAPACKATTIGTVVAGVLANFTVSLFDAYGNAVTAANQVVTITFQPPVVHTLRATYLGTNKYSASLGIELSGSYAASINVGGVPINNGNTQLVTVVAGPYNPINSVFGGSGLVQAVAGAATVFTVALYDSYDNPVLVGVAQVAASMDPSSPGPATFATDNVGNGTYIVTYTATRAGTYTMDVFVGPPGVAPTEIFTPLVMTTNVPAAQNTRVLGPSERGQFGAGSVQWFKIGLRDVYNNTLESAANAYVSTSLASVTGEEFSTATPVLLPPPFVQYNISYSLTIAQAYYLDVLVNGQPIGGGPFDVLIMPGAAAPALSAAVSVSGGALTSSLTGRRNRFLVELRDEFGNPAPGGSPANISAYVTGAQRFSVAVTQVSPFQFECSYKIDKVGAYSLWVLLDGVNIEGSPFAIRIEWAYTMTAIVIGLVALVVIILFVFVTVVVCKKRKQRRYARF